MGSSCDVCGKLMPTDPGHEGEPHVCSPACRAKAQKFLEEIARITGSALFVQDKKQTEYL